MRERLAEIHAHIRDARLFVALHMHAGDGNVHTNIPVDSADYRMLHEADGVVARIMALVRDLGGVVSGEHGIGLTKIGLMEREKIDAFVNYKLRVDPKERFNRGKLRDPFVHLSQGEETGYSFAYAPVAQLDRASGFEPEGRGFESLRARHTHIR